MTDIKTDTKFRYLSAEQLAALTEYAERKGRYWKNDLNLAWYNASESGYLQEIRNQFGPSWLVRFSFTDAATHRTRK